MSIELKPCPFCGGSDFEIVENGRIWSGMKYSEPVSVSVRHWCPAAPGQPSRMIERVGRDEASAVTAWNTRHTLSQQPATPKPVGFTYQAEIEYADSTGGNGSFWRVPPDLDDEAVPLYTHPAPSAPKDDQIAALVNKVRDIARMFHDHQSLRERIAIELVPALKASQEVKSNAERWRYAIADSGNQTMNFIDIFDDWNGDGDFVEAFDKARLADKKEGSAA